MREKIGEVILHLSLNNKPLKSGKYPIYIRVQHKNTNRYYSTHCEMGRKEFERFLKFPENDHPAVLCFRHFADCTNTLVRAEAFSFSNLSQMAARSRENTIQELIKEREKEFLKNRKFSTAMMYQNLHVRFNEFLGDKPTPVSRITEDRCRQFLVWLRDEKKNNPTSINIKARNLTAVLNAAIKQHLIKNNPMDNVKKPSPRRRNMEVSSASLRKLLEADFAVLGEELRWLHYWRAVYYGNGMNIQDLLRLRRSDINFENAEIRFIRQKTADSSGREIRVPLIPEFVNELNALSGGKAHIIPDLDEYEDGSLEEFKRIRQIIKNINTHLEKITTILKIPEHITTYTGRHCFATKLQQSSVPIEFISSAMGHSSIRTTQNYLDGYTSEQRRKNAQLLTQ